MHAGSVHAFHGVWDEAVRAQFNQRPDLHINTLELLAVDWLLQLCGAHFANSSFVLRCDNRPSVDQLCSFRARKSTSAVLLHSIDLAIAAHNLNPLPEHVAGVENTLADLLSRQELDLFRERVADLFPSHPVFFEQVAHLRNFGITLSLL